MWDNITLIFYMLCAFYGYFCIKKYLRNNMVKKGRIFLFSLYIFWVIIAVFRRIGRINGVTYGGADAPEYVEYFEQCLANSNLIYATRTEILFQLLNKGIRYFTSDYHWFFFLIYSFIILSYFLFIKEFGLNKTNFFVYFMLFIPFLKSFCAIRTHIAIAFILIGIVFLKKNKPLLALIFCIISIFFQKASLLYALFPLFHYFFQKRKFSARWGIGLSLCGVLGGYFGKNIFLSGNLRFLSDGAYWGYVSKTNNLGFLIDYLKLIPEQLFILLLLLCLSKKINNEKHEMKDKTKIKMLLELCYYDLMMIPICCILNVWRGADYFYLPRIVMLGYMLFIIRRKVTKSSKKLFDIVTVCCIIIIFIIRLSTMYDVSKLMPYAFQLF